MSFAEYKGVWIGLAGLALVVGLIIWLLAGAQPFRLVILFDDAGTLKKEDPVMWKSYEIGKVEEIRPLVENKIGVTIKIREDYAAKIRQGSTFTLKRAALLGLVGRDAIEVTIPDAPAPPYSPGEQVYGINAPKPSLLREGKELGLQYWNQLKDEANRLIENAGNSPYREDFENVAAEIRDLATKGAQRAVEGLGNFAQDHRKEIESAQEALRKLKDKLRKSGDQPGARKVEEEIEKLEKGLRP